MMASVEERTSEFGAVAVALERTGGGARYAAAEIALPGAAGGHFDPGCKALLGFIGRAHKGFELRCAFYEAWWAWCHHERRSIKLCPRWMRHYPPVMRALAAAERIVFLLRLPVFLQARSARSPTTL